MVFCGLDRDVLAREREDCLDLILRYPETLIVPVWRSRNLFSEVWETGATPVPAYLTPEETSGFISIAKDQFYLGKQTREDTFISYLAIDISNIEEDEATNKLVS